MFRPMKAYAAKDHVTAYPRPTTSSIVELMPRGDRRVGGTTSAIDGHTLRPGDFMHPTKFFWLRISRTDCTIPYETAKFDIIEWK